ncbi:putative tRNA pseudouridine synthase A-like 2 [Homarus americanus]|uniref:Putative tRNA pseudouridine synthase A-like 2 n=4 Tax=Homarus americanus TaxID=6706 RepID=A0A8J5MYT3_HOMAM|nr:putative tRNA pseudouridine synthase A-like 2 [Homarus americanus]
MLKWLATLPLHNFNISEASNGNDDQLESSNGRTPLGRAASRLENYRGAGHQDKGSDDEAEDEDEGDLEQYRVVPVMKVAEAAPHGTEQCINGTNTHIVNGVERDDASIIKTGKIISNGDEEQSPDTKDHYTENIG